MGEALWRVDRFFDSLDGLKFIQLGANNGKTLDPLTPYIRKHGWSGVFVEPVDKQRRKLRRSYRGVPGLQYEEAAIMAHSGSCTFYEVPDYDVVSTATPSNWKVEKAIKKGVVKKRQVPCMTIMELVDKYDAYDADILQMDIEGAEWEVLKKIDFTRFYPTVIRYEEKHLKEDKGSAVDLLVSMGYEIEREPTEDVTAWIPS